MLDHRIFTFLKLCETMNYRKTSEIMHLTQPAVTQQIQYLEDIYGVKLFQYSKRTLSLTEQGKKLEEYARSVVYNDALFQTQILNLPQRKFSIGATKTIGDYMIDDFISRCLNQPQIEFKLIIDNTNTLLRQLNNFELDFLMIEGYFDKMKYGYHLMKEEELVGICSLSHPFANKEVDLKQVFHESLILRESGSGTRSVFENFLLEHNDSIDMFQNCSIISSFRVILNAVASNLGISFVYSAIPKVQKEVAVFRIKGYKIMHEMNYIYLKNSKSVELINSLVGI